jgi:hypothetical protein
MFNLKFEVMKKTIRIKKIVELVEQFVKENPDKRLELYRELEEAKETDLNVEQDIEDWAKND